MKIVLDQNSPIPLYLQIAHALEQYIRSENIAVGEALPTLNEIAEAASVSIHTVQKALQQLIDEGVCHRSGSRKLILGRLPFDRASIRKRNVIIICHQSGEKCLYTDQIAMRMFAGIQSEAAGIPDVELVLAGIPLSDSLKFYLDNPYMNVLGIVLLHWQNKEEIADISREFPDVRFVHLNYVIHDVELLPENVCGIYNDDYSGGYQGAEYLLSHNVQHPAFFELTQPALNDTYKYRCEGFLAATNAQGITGLAFKLPANVQGVSYSETIMLHKDFFARTWATHPEIDGVLTCYDPLAEAIGEYLLQHGLDEKIKLISYDGYLEMNTCIYSAVTVNYYGMGQKAVQFLVEPDDKPRFLRILPKMLFRNSGRVKARSNIIVVADAGLKSAAAAS